jgi:ubiquinone/menaquinone biosynthesis C-methylase UbiE
MKKEKQLEEIYANRFDNKSEMRTKLWGTLCKYYFQKFVKKTDTVVDLPAGYCEFINSIECKRKIAIDLNPSVRKMANKNVEVCLAKSTSLPKYLENNADVVFVSNFFEHLADQTELLDTLKEIKKIMKKNGQLLILQPNIRLVGGAYWDYLDHTLPLTEKSLSEALELSGFKIKYMKTRFLPFSTDGKMPVIPFLIRIYLAFPPLQFLLGKQTFVVARKI